METAATIAQTVTLPVLQPMDLSTHLIRQEWERYSSTDHAVWRLLYAKRMRELDGVACDAFFQGAEAIGLNECQIPDLRRLNGKLAALTGWRALPVDGFISAKLFFQCLAARKFPTTVSIRSMERLNYLPEPDIFHDVFGHVPMHADPRFARLLQRFAQLAETTQNEADMERLARFFWFTVEFGLLMEKGSIKVYGSGLISSAADCANAMSDNCERRRFNLEEVMNQTFSTSKIQKVLFVIDSFEQLEELVTSFR